MVTDTTGFLDEVGVGVVGAVVVVVVVEPEIWETRPLRNHKPTRRAVHFHVVERRRKLRVCCISVTLRDIALERRLHEISVQSEEKFFSNNLNNGKPDFVYVSIRSISVAAKLCRVGIFRLNRIVYFAWSAIYKKNIPFLIEISFDPVTFHAFEIKLGSSLGNCLSPTTVH